MDHGVHGAIWIIRLLEELKIKCEGTVQLYCNNKATISTTHIPIHDVRIKHEEVDGHFIKEKLDGGIINIKYVPTS